MKLWQWIVGVIAKLFSSTSAGRIAEFDAVTKSQRVDFAGVSDEWRSLYTEVKELLKEERARTERDMEKLEKRMQERLDDCEARCRERDDRIAGLIERLSRGL